MDHANTQPRIYLFSKPWEIVSLVWPMVVLAGCSYLFFADIQGTTAKNNAVQFIAGFVFLNVTHVMFTIYFIALFPEARAWLQSYSPNARRLLFAKWALILAALLGIFYCTLSMAGPVPLLWTFIIGVISNYHHTISQMRGFSSAYNVMAAAEYKFEGRELERQKSLEKVEARLFQALLVVASAGLWFQLQPHTPYRLYFFSAQFLIFSAILLNSIRFAKAAATPKTIYLIRLIFYPLGTLDLRFMLGVQFIHGIEYTMLYFKMWNRSAVKHERSKVFICTLLIPLAVFYGLLSLARYKRGFGIELIDAYPQLSTFIVVLATISTALNYLHFYLDREIFRMRDKRVRDHIGPLIAGKSKAG